MIFINSLMADFSSIEKFVFSEYSVSGKNLKTTFASKKYLNFPSVRYPVENLHPRAPAVDDVALQLFLVKELLPAEGAVELQPSAVVGIHLSHRDNLATLPTGKVVRCAAVFFKEVCIVIVAWLLLVNHSQMVL